MKVKKTKYVNVKGYDKEPSVVDRTSKRKVDPTYTQYSDGGSVIRPAPTLKFIKELQSNIYKLSSDMQGFFFIPHEVKTDDLLKFEDKRQNIVTSEINKFWKMKSNFNDLGFVHKRGMLLYGSPGTGKSCILKIVMNNIMAEGDIVLIVKQPHLLTIAMNVIRQIEPSRRVLAILEDVDELVRYNEHELLGLFDGDSQQDGMVLLGTTNYVDKLPPRMLRTGRFDRVIEISNPGSKGRLAYFNMKLKGKETKKVISTLVKVTKGFNFSQMKEIIVSCYCLNYNLSDALNRIKSGLEVAKPGRDKYLESKINSITAKEIIKANVGVK